MKTKIGKHDNKIKENFDGVSNGFAAEKAVSSAQAACGCRNRFPGVVMGLAG